MGSYYDFIAEYGRDIKQLLSKAKVEAIRLGKEAGGSEEKYIQLVNDKLKSVENVYDKPVVEFIEEMLASNGEHFFYEVKDVADLALRISNHYGTEMRQVVNALEDVFGYINSGDEIDEKKKEITQPESGETKCKICGKPSDPQWSAEDGEYCSKECLMTYEEELNENFNKFNDSILENFNQKIDGINEIDGVQIIINEAKDVKIGSLQKGDIMKDPHGVDFYVHWSRINRRYTGVEVFGCRLENLRDIENNKKFSTWSYKGTDRTAKVISKASTTLQNRFDNAWREQEDKRYERETKQMDTIAPKWDDKSGAAAPYGKGGMQIKAKDGKYYKAGDVVDVAWSNGTAPAILGNLDGRLFNQAGEVAVMSIKGIGYGKAKARFLTPEYIVGASANASKYNVEELLQQAGASKDKAGVRRAHKKSIRDQFGGWREEGD